jgi:hypothetical protein
VEPTEAHDLPVTTKHVNPPTPPLAKGGQGGFPIKARKTRKLVAGLSLTAIALSLIALWTCKGLQAARLSEWVPRDLPMLDLNLKLVDLNGKEITPSPQSRLLRGAQKATQPPAAAASEGCPELIGGDTGERSTLSDMKERPGDCPKAATWIVRCHPIAFSLYFRDANKVLAQFDGKTPLTELFQTRFIQGIFYEPLHSASVRAEDLKLEGLQGAFLAAFLREALQAGGILHYDVVHGKRGFVFSFVREACPVADKALPIVVRVLARNGYRIPGLTEPVIEMRIGLQRIFLTQFEDRVYLANGIEALLNVLESLPPPAKNLPNTPLVLTTRADAFVDKLLPVMVGEPTWTIDWGVDFSEEAPGVLQFAPGKFARQLRPKIFKGVLAGIPQDVFSAVATSFQLAPDMTAEQWRQLALQGPGEPVPGSVSEIPPDPPLPKGGGGDSTPRRDPPVQAGAQEAGVAILWDLTADNDPPSTVGVIIANQTAPDDVEKFKRYFADQELTAECGGGTVFLAATSRSLLTRMKESCERQSLSILDWERGAKTKAFESAQLVLFMDPAVAMRELFLAGGAKSGDTGDFEPQWKQQYEKAKEAMRKDGEKVFRSLPIFAYAGNAPPKAPAVLLKGFTFKQGESR